MAKEKTDDQPTVPMLVEQIRVLSEQLTNATKTYAILRKTTDGEEPEERITGFRWTLSLEESQISSDVDAGEQLTQDVLVLLTNYFAGQLVDVAAKLHRTTTRLTELLEVTDDQPVAT